MPQGDDLELPSEPLSDFGLEPATESAGETTLELPTAQTGDVGLELPNAPTGQPTGETTLELPSAPAGQPTGETALELPNAPAGQPTGGTTLELPSAPGGGTAPEESREASLPGPAGARVDQSPGPLGNLVAAHLQRIEVALLARVLATTLAGALPAPMVRVERRRSLVERLTRRPGTVVGVRVTAGDTSLGFRAPEIGVTEATVGHTVRGVVLATETVPVGEWLTRLGELLTRIARDDERTRLALEQALAPGNR